MRMVIQRVKKAKVVVEGKAVGQIGQGLLLFLGIGETDREIKNQDEKIKKLAVKILKIRIFDLSFASPTGKASEGKKEKFDKSVLDIKGEILVVPQFTLFADCSKGNRPFFGSAASPPIAKPLFEKLITELKKTGLKVESGVFGAKMEVEAVNDGPVTIILEN